MKGPTGESEGSTDSPGGAGGVAYPAVPLLTRGPSTPGALLTEELFPLVYAELRRLARARLAREPGRGGGHILQPTALVHEAYLRLVGEAADKTLTWTSRAHFFGAAALAMRRILVEHARRRRAPSAGLEGDLLPSTGVFGEAEGRAVDFEELDAALTAFAQSDERRHGVVMLRFFAGLSVEATAQVLNLSEPTVKRDWNYARAWLVEWIGARRGGPGA